MTKKEKLSEQAELLTQYVDYNHTSYRWPLIILFCFIGAKIYFYGIPTGVNENIILLSLSSASVWGYFQLSDVYEKWKKEKKANAALIKKTVSYIILYKGIFILSWLIFIFWPLSATSLYGHFIGYLFVFCAISVYLSTSSPYHLLFIIDLVLAVGFSLFITIINFGHIETLYVQIPIIIFALYSLPISTRNRRAAKKLISNSAALNNALKKAEYAHKIKSDFLAIMSHEIRTPMAGIIGMIDFLKDAKLDKKEQECLNTMSSCSNTLLNTLNDILDISKMQAGQLSINKSKCNFYDLVKHVENSFIKLDTKNDIDFEVHIHANVPEYIHADMNRVQQVLFNLLTNAFKFTHKGQVHVDITYYNKKIRISVKDSGIGISPQNQQKLFQKFSQAEEFITREYGGSGLGLFIVRSLVQRMGGELGVTSTEGKGSVFWFEIPALPPKEETAVNHQPNSSGESHKAKTLNILLVDDNKLNRTIASHYLKTNGHQVTEADSGKAAIEKVQQHKFNVILMDMQMPSMDGMEATERIIKLGKEYEEIPIIALTANVLQSDIDRCHASGMVDHIAKPIDKELMFEIIQKHI